MKAPTHAAYFCPHLLSFIVSLLAPCEGVAPGCDGDFCIARSDVPRPTGLKQLLQISQPINVESLVERDKIHPPPRKKVSREESVRAREERVRIQRAATANDSDAVLIYWAHGFFNTDVQREDLTQHCGFPCVQAAYPNDTSYEMADVLLSFPVTPIVPRNSRGAASVARESRSRYGATYSKRYDAVMSLDWRSTIPWTRIDALSFSMHHNLEDTASWETRRPAAVFVATNCQTPARNQLIEQLVKRHVPVESIGKCHPPDTFAQWPADLYSDRLAENRSLDFFVGEHVLRRDQNSSWRRGYVTQQHPLKVTLLDKPYQDGDRAYTWDEVRHLEDQRPQDRIAAINKYRVYLALEESAEPGYVTETLTEGLLSGAVTVYYGAPDIDNYVPKTAIINANNYKLDIEDIAKQIKLAINSKTYWQRYRKWLSQKPQAWNGGKVARAFPWSDGKLALCRLCRYAVANRMGKAWDWHSQQPVGMNIPPLGDAFWQNWRTL